MLAEFGTDVIKVETPNRDSTRKTGPAAKELMAPLFLGSNRGKRSVVLDLKTTWGRETLIELAKTADVQSLDGYVCLMPCTDQDWLRFFDSCGLEEAARDPRFAGICERTQPIDEIYNLAGEQTRKRTTADWVELCQSSDIPCAPLNRLEDLESDPHLR